MKNKVKDYESIYGNTTVGHHADPDFTITVCPYESETGECYFKCYNRAPYMDATHVVRLNLRKPEKVAHRERDSKEEWILSTDEKKVICQFLDEASRNFRLGATNWHYTLFSWNNELGLLNADFPDQYSNPFEAFVNGFYDTDENRKDPSYLLSTLKRPDYTQLS